MRYLELIQRNISFWKKNDCYRLLLIAYVLLMNFMSFFFKLISLDFYSVAIHRVLRYLHIKVLLLRKMENTEYRLTGGTWQSIFWGLKSHRERKLLFKCPVKIVCPFSPHSEVMRTIPVSH